MQEVTDGAFWTLVHNYGGADVYWTEYFRVHSTSTPEKKILEAITGNTTGRPVIAQMIGNDIPELVRTAKFCSSFRSPRSISTSDAPRRSSIASAPAAGCCASRSASTPSSARCATRCRSSSR